MADLYSVLKDALLDYFNPEGLNDLSEDEVADIGRAAHLATSTVLARFIVQPMPDYSASASSIQQMDDPYKPARDARRQVRMVEHHLPCAGWDFGKTDDERLICFADPAVECFTVNGKWEPLCERHATYEGDRRRPLGQASSAPDQEVER